MKTPTIMRVSKVYVYVYIFSVCLSLNTLFYWEILKPPLSKKIQIFPRNISTSTETWMILDEKTDDKTQKTTWLRSNSPQRVSEKICTCASRKSRTTETYRAGLTRSRTSCFISKTLIFCAWKWTSSTKTSCVIGFIFITLASFCLFWVKDPTLIKSEQKKYSRRASFWIDRRRHLCEE